MPSTAKASKSKREGQQRAGRRASRLRYVTGSITIDASASRWLKLKRFFGPGLLVAIGYMDPGNWATDIQAGSQFGYALLWVVAFPSLAAIFRQMRHAPALNCGLSAVVRRELCGVNSAT